jgi:transcriptional regulator GlxA family with amidase domain
VSSQPILFSKVRIRDKRIMLCVQLLYKNPRLRLRQLANIIELSPSRLGHLFKKQTGMSVGKFAREVAVQRAKDLLEATDLTHKEIRDRVGLQDKANFFRAFRQRIKTTPSKCRSANRSRFDNRAAVLTTENNR